MKPNVKIEAVDPYYIPTKATSGSSGYDLRACLTAGVWLAPRSIAKIHTGIRLEIPRGLEAQVRSRSGMAADHGVVVLNSPGTIDSDYRGYVSVILANHGRFAYKVEDGDRIAQLVFASVVYPTWVDVRGLRDSDRGDNGFGSTGVH